MKNDLLKIVNTFLRLFKLVNPAGSEETTGLFDILKNDFTFTTTDYDLQTGVKWRAECTIKNAHIVIAFRETGDISLLITTNTVKWKFLQALFGETIKCEVEYENNSEFTIKVNGLIFGKVRVKSGGFAARDIDSHVSYSLEALPKEVSLYLGANAKKLKAVTDICDNILKKGVLLSEINTKI